MRKTPVLHGALSGALLLALVVQGCAQTPSGKKKETVPVRDSAQDKTAYYDSVNAADPYRPIERIVSFADAGEMPTLARKGEKYGYVDRYDRVVIPFRYDFGAATFSEGLAFVRLDWKVGYIDTTGKTVIPFEYESAGDFREGLALVSKVTDNGRKFGFVNREGAVAIPLEYAEAREFSLGLAAVARDAKFGYIDRTGKLVIPFQFESALAFSPQTQDAMVKLQGSWKRIDRQGKLIEPRR